MDSSVKEMRGQHEDMGAFLPENKTNPRTLQKNLTKSPNYDKQSFILLGFALSPGEPPNGRIPGSENPKRKTTFTRKS
jgi:hypothetical protein